MVRDKNPTLAKTCIICRSKTTNCHLKIRNGKRGSEEEKTKLRWNVLCAESFCMLFGLPQNHPFVAIFVGRNGTNHAQLCTNCFEELNHIHHIFWQLQSLEFKLTQLQTSVHGRLRGNYDAVPVSTVFARMGEEDIANNLGALTYDEIVKVLFERIKDVKRAWPQAVHLNRWQQACDNAEKLSTHFQNLQALEDEPEMILPSIIKTETVNCSLVLSEGHGFTKTIEAIDDDTDGDALILVDETEQSGDVPSDIDCEDHSNSDMFLDNRESDPEYEVRKPSRKKSISKKSKIRKARLPKPKVAAVKDAKPNLTRYLCIEDPEICSRTYSAKKHLNAHIRTFHQQRTYLCDQDGCTGRFESREKLTAHVEKIHEKKRHTEVCETCGVEVPRGDLKRHYYLRHLGVGKYTCERCSMDFNDENELRAHEQLHVQAEYPFLCVVCEKLFTNSLDLKAHVSSNHLSSGLKCSVCGIMKANEFLLQRHMKIHARTRRYMCGTCGKNFASKGYLNYHEEHHHTNVGKRFPCDVCGKTFSHMKNVLRHMITHSEDKPFKCKICLKTFNYSHLLKKHEEIHSGTKNYGCEICGKRFRQEQNLKQHMRSHRPKPEKPGDNNNKKSSKASSSPVEEEVLVESVSVIKVDNIETKEELKCDETTTIEFSDSSSTTVGTRSISLVPVVQVDTSHGQSQLVQEIQLTPAPNQQQTGTTTVVFVSAQHPNIHWIQ